MSKEKTTEPMTSESKLNDELAAPAGDLQEYPSSEDLASGRARDEDVPEKDETASEAEDPENLHGSLHGNWTRTDRQ